MAKVRKREGKNGTSWQIDYFDPNGKLTVPSYHRCAAGAGSGVDGENRHGQQTMSRDTIINANYI